MVLRFPQYQGPAPVSHRVVWVSALVMIAVFFLSQRWIKSKVIDADVVSYYSYLPAVFVHQDITMSYSLGDEFYADKVWGVIWKDGFGPVQKYTMGMAIMYLPWFLAGHATAYLVGAPPDGYSLPYRFFLQISAVGFLFLGFFFLRKVLLTYFSDRITAAVLVILLLGTNMFYYTMGQAAMPHVPLFALISVWLWLIIRFYSNPIWKWALWLGLIGSLVTLIRPNHLLLWLLPLLYGVYSGATLRKRVQFIAQHFGKYLSWALIGFLLVLPQLLYWHHLTDRWIYYSYGDEGFFFNNPQVGRVLFSFRNGWLIYSPIMVLGVVGLGAMWLRLREWALPVTLSFTLGFYVIASWWCWWYGGSFGQRVLIDFYPLLAIGIGIVLTGIDRWVRQRGVRRIVLGAAAFLLALNLFQTLQYTRFVIHYDAMTAEAYWASFGRLHVPENYADKLRPPDYEAALRGIYE
ncbi:MAG: hypothetical protein AAGN35_21025 [Bacteroidota bacterium]